MIVISSTCLLPSFETGVLVQSYRSLELLKLRQAALRSDLGPFGG